ncbi:MAG: amidohydrolase family protein [Acidobacteriota bacterium]
MRLAATCVLLWVAFSPRLNAQSGPVLVFEHATVIEATDRPPLADVSVTIRGAVIESIRPTGDAPAIGRLPGTTVVDASGKFMIPGLWDMHAHLFALDKAFPVLIANGITGVRDMYSGNAPRAYAPWRNRPDSVRFVVSGMIDGPVRPESPGAILVSNADEARLGVELLAANGAEFIKVYSSLSREAYLALAAEARRIGIPFAGHVPETVSPAEAAEAGQLSQEHLINILLASSTKEDELRAARLALLTDPALSAPERARLFGFPPEEGLLDTYDPPKAAALFETLANYGVWQTPTLVVLKRYAEAGPEILKTPYMQDLPADKLAEFKAHVTRLLKRYEQLVGDMHRVGIQFLAGTDTSPATGIPLGESLHDELELLVESGLTPLEALQSATRSPAFYFGVLSVMGTVEAGKSADLVLLDANPLDDIRNTRKIRSVVMRGRYYPRETLDAMLAANAK